MENALTGKRILITQSTEFMGPVLCDVFAQQGAEVVASSEYLVDPDAAGRRFKRIPDSRSGWRARRRSVGWSPPAKTLSSRRTCAAAPLTASLGRYSRCAAAGSCVDGAA